MAWFHVHHYIKPKIIQIEMRWAQICIRYLCSKGFITYSAGFKQEIVCSLHISLAIMPRRIHEALGLKSIAQFNHMRIQTGIMFINNAIGHMLQAIPNVNMIGKNKI